jgi:hypothetical protein
VQLRALDRFAVSIMLDEPEGRGEPVDRQGKVLVGEVGKHGIRRH